MLIVAADFWYESLFADCEQDSWFAVNGGAACLHQMCCGAGLLSQSIAPTLGNIGSRIAQLLQVKAVQQAVR